MLARSRTTLSQPRRIRGVSVALALIMGFGVAPAAKATALPSAPEVSSGPAGSVHVELLDESGVVGEGGVPRISTASPEFEARVCVAGVPADGLSARFEILGSSNELVVVGTVPVLVSQAPEGVCGTARWLSTADLGRGTTYTVSVTGVVGVAELDAEVATAPFEVAPDLVSPTVVAPAPGAHTSAKQPELMVSVDVPDSAGLEVEFHLWSPLVLGDTGIITVEHGQARWQPTTLLAAGTYEWRARTRLADGSQEGSWTTTQTFTVEGPGTPQMVSPANGEGVDPSRPHFAAEVAVPPGGKARGVFQLFTPNGEVWTEGESDFVTADGIVEWMPDLRRLPMWNGAWTWRVRAGDETSLSSWSAKRTVYAALPPGQFWFGYSPAIRGGVELNWREPSAGDEAPIIKYVVEASPSGKTVTVPGDAPRVNYQHQVILTGLAEGYHEFRVTAYNKYGTYRIEHAVDVAPLRSLPPESLDVSVEGNKARVTWDLPTDVVGGDILHYEVVVHPGGSAVTVPAHVREYTISDVPFGQQFTVRVAAVTAAGVGESGSAYFLAETVPGAPEIARVGRGDSEVLVSWIPPEADGWSPVTAYEVSVEPGGHKRRVDAGATSASVGGLTNGVEYIARVTALNRHGSGPASASSTPVTPLSQHVDTDGDDLPDVLEERVGSMVDLVDSDFDGLSDYDEVTHLLGATSPTSPDSDGDGSEDDVADNDGDGFTNAQEIEFGTNPLSSDTDADRLEDAAERGRGTNPTLADTDGDGLDDGDEVRLGLDPLLADSDDDGTPDGSASVTTTVDSGGSTAVLRGAAGDAVRASIKEQEFVVAGAMAPAATITAHENAGQLSATSLTWKLDATTVDASREIAVMQRTSDRGWKVVDSGVTLERSAGRITIESPELGVTYGVVDLNTWRASLYACEDAREGRTPLDVEVLIDASPGVVGHDPTSEGVRALQQMLQTLAPSDRVRIRIGRGVVTHWGGGGVSIDQSVDEISAPDESHLRDPWITETLTGLRADWPQLDLSDSGVGNPTSWFTGSYVERLLGDPFDWSGMWGEDPSHPDAVAWADPCRDLTRIVLTDGALEPEASGWEPTDYVPFLQRSKPVHVLDVGAGDASWLVDVADRTGGTYTHVPTREPEPRIPRPKIEYGEDPSDLTDSDGDGLSDWIETNGYRPALGGGEITSDPNQADTDDDGIIDGDEAGEPVQSRRGDTVQPRVFFAVSDPRFVDSDWDGLGDVDELDAGLDPFDYDVDQDGLPDGMEAEWGTSPTNPDTDADGYDDEKESWQGERGFDPHTPNIPIDKETWFHQFSLGFFCGDTEVCRLDTIPWLSGNILSGVAVFGDVRDLVFSLDDPDLNTAILGVSVIPGVGDYLGASAKIVRALPNLSPSEALAVPKLLKKIGPTASAASTIRHVEPDLVRALEAVGASAATIDRLLLENNLADLKKVLASPRLVTPQLAGILTRIPEPIEWRQTEELLRTELAHVGKVSREPLFLGANKPLFCRGCRIPDALVKMKIGQRDHLHLHEAKVGYVRGTFARRQFFRDLALAQAKKVDQVVWHFFPSPVTGKIGPSKYFMDQMEDEAARLGVDFQIVLHLPDGFPDALLQ